MAAVDELGGRMAEGCSNRGGERIVGHFLKKKLLALVCVLG